MHGAPKPVFCREGALKKNKNNSLLALSLSGPQDETVCYAQNLLMFFFSMLQLNIQQH